MIDGKPLDPAGRVEPHEQLTRPGSSPLELVGVPAGASPQAGFGGPSDFERVLNKASAFTCRGACRRLCNESSIYNLSDNFPAAVAESITHSGCALHIASQKRLMVRCNFLLLPLIMWRPRLP